MYFSPLIPSNPHTLSPRPQIWPLHPVNLYEIYLIKKKMIALLLLSAAVGCYLLYAIVKPEKF
ncbi:MAG: potassium-transporting ATPase subunit F [Saprospirales bacterium]|nr:potassium-transporting ATPase subunit F [Saprospirales bacterium]